MESLVMEHEIVSRLTPVRTRQQKLALLRCVGRGLWFGSAAAIVLGLLNLGLLNGPLTTLPELLNWPVHWAVLPGLALAVLVVGPSVAAWLGRPRDSGWQAAAAAIDRHYHLQDRTVTALRFLDKPNPRPLEEMQIADCAQHLVQVDPRAVVQVGLPSPMPGALVLLALAVAAIVLPVVLGPSAASSVESAPETAAQPPQAEPSPGADTAATGRSDVEINWRVAPPGEILVNRTNLLTRATLKQVVSGTGQGTAGKEAGEADRHAAAKQIRKGSETVLEGELLPLEHRRTIRLYFESIRPQDDQLLNAAPAVP